MKEKNQQRYLAMFALVNSFISDMGFKPLTAESFFTTVSAINRSADNKVMAIQHIRELTAIPEIAEFKLVTPPEDDHGARGVPSLFTKWAQEKNVDLSTGVKPTPIYMGLKNVKDIYEFIQLNIDMVT